MQRIIVAFVIFLFSFPVNSQEKDFGIWYTVSGKYSVSKKIKLEIAEEWRTKSNALETDQLFTDLGGSYKFNKYFTAGAYYRFIMKKENNGDFFGRNRFYSDLNFEYPLKRFNIKYRFRMQRQTNRYAEEADDKIPTLINRHKFELEYNINNSKFTPSLFYEAFYRLKYINPYFMESTRLGLGTSYQFSKKHNVQASYLINKDLYPKPEYAFILALGYRYSF